MSRSSGKLGPEINIKSSLVAAYPPPPTHSLCISQGCSEANPRTEVQETNAVAHLSSWAHSHPISLGLPSLVFHHPEGPGPSEKGVETIGNQQEFLVLFPDVVTGSEILSTLARVTKRKSSPDSNPGMINLK